MECDICRPDLRSKGSITNLFIYSANILFGEDRDKLTVVFLPKVANSAVRVKSLGAWFLRQGRKWWDGEVTRAWRKTCWRRWHGCAWLVFILANGHMPWGVIYLQHGLSGSPVADRLTLHITSKWVQMQNPSCQLLVFPRRMDGGSWHCIGDSDQDHPQEKEMQKGKMVVWGALTNSWEKKRSERQRRKGKIYSFECRFTKYSKEK